MARPQHHRLQIDFGRQNNILTEHEKFENRKCDAVSPRNTTLTVQPTIRRLLFEHERNITIRKSFDDEQAGSRTQTVNKNSIKCAETRNLKRSLLNIYFAIDSFIS